jgi:CheY-like chemotaxis protein
VEKFMFEGKPVAKRALVVNDCAVARSAILVMLQRSGWEAIGAADGAEALVLAGAWRLDLIITDLKLRKLSGLQLVRGLKTDPELPAVRVFLLVEHDQRPGPAGELADEVLVKDSLIQKQLQERLASVFGSAHTPRKRDSARRRAPHRGITSSIAGSKLLSSNSY